MTGSPHGLNTEKARLNLFGEVKWSKVSAPLSGQVQDLIRVFFEEVRQGHLKVRIMFRQNVHEAVGLTQEANRRSLLPAVLSIQSNTPFGLMHRPPAAEPTKLRVSSLTSSLITKKPPNSSKGFLLALER